MINIGYTNKRGMPSAESTKIFKAASTTYFTSSLFFPSRIQEKIFTLYAFVRVADNYVDSIPQNAEGFYRFRAAYYAYVTSQALPADFSLDPTTQSIIKNFVTLQNLHSFKQVWVDAFLKAMELDLYKAQYHTMAELKSYMYGSAEVIGLMICACLGIDTKAYPTARLLGRAMQYANFLRDVAEDITLGRQYIPDEVLHVYGLPELSYKTAEEQPTAFAALYRNEGSRYHHWNSAAQNGFVFLPLYARIPVATATHMYTWTVQTICRNPLFVFKKKIKPTKLQVVQAAITEWFITRVA